MPQINKVTNHNQQKPFKICMPFMEKIITSYYKIVTKS